jgi:hypothetical protein
MVGGKNSGIIGLRRWQQHDYCNWVDLHSFITGMFENDPRPVYQTETDSRRIYGIRIFDVDVI